MHENLTEFCPRKRTKKRTCKHVMHLMSVAWLYAHQLFVHITRARGRYDVMLQPSTTYGQPRRMRGRNGVLTTITVQQRRMDWWM